MILMTVIKSLITRIIGLGKIYHGGGSSVETIKQFIFLKTILFVNIYQISKKIKTQKNSYICDFI